MINTVAFPFRIDNHSTEDMIGAHGEVIKPKTFTQYSGMSLRDYFAAKFAAAQSVMTSADRDFIKPDYNYPGGLRVAERIAQTSYQLADAMLKARDEVENHG